MDGCKVVKYHGNGKSSVNIILYNRTDYSTHPGRHIFVDKMIKSWIRTAYTTKQMLFIKTNLNKIYRYTNASYNIV